MRFTSAALALLTLVLPALAAPASLITVERADGPTSGKYIVTLKQGVDKTDFLSQAKNFGVTDKWDIINGFAGHCDGPTLDYLRSHSDVESIAEDGMTTINSVVTQTNAPWGLQRISQPAPLSPTSNITSLTYNYTYDSSGGRGVDIYIIDSGINIQHVSFQGRARWGATFGPYPNADGNGHGTHCAGIAGSFDYGVAKSANLIAVKVQGDDGRGFNSDMISGMNWVRNTARSSGRPSVASISLESGASTVVDNAVASLTGSGVHTVVAAGNSNTDASTVSPARAPSALTVAALNITDARATFSNYGKPVKVFAPGVKVVSTWIGNTTATNISSGTSMAAPHISGLVAYFIALYGNTSPANMIAFVQTLAIQGAVKDPGPETVNLLAWNVL